MSKKGILLKNYVSGLGQAGHNCTLLGVGPVSEVVVRATFEACREHACPAIFIASRNQVDLKSLGHGYLMGGMDQQEFVALLGRFQDKAGYEGPVYICRDHGGPWQRNVELNEKYPVDRAMAVAKESLRADIEAGFNYIHIDPTKCPLPYTQADLCTWTVDLISFCEDARRELSKEAIDYEVGSEDIQGGLTTSDTFESFLQEISRGLESQGLPLPSCVVGQTGTLARIDRNVGHFDRAKAQELAGIAMKYGVGFKEHNADYLSAASCRVHPDLGITGMNVAPEFGLLETDACLALGDEECKLVREGWLEEKKASGLRELLLELTFSNSPWQKWMTDEIKELDEKAIAADSALRLLIARVCGHYVYDMDEVRVARARLYDNVQSFELVPNAERFVVERVRDRIEFYIKHLRLSGANKV